jgi:hypothetical protein
MTNGAEMGEAGSGSDGLLGAEATKDRRLPLEVGDQMMCLS